MRLMKTQLKVLYEIRYPQFTVPQNKKCIVVHAVVKYSKKNLMAIEKMKKLLIYVE